MAISAGAVATRKIGLLFARAGHRAKVLPRSGGADQRRSRHRQNRPWSKRWAPRRRKKITRTTFRCSPYYTNSALYPMIEQIKRRLRWQAGDTPYTKLAKLEQILANYNWVAEDVVPLFAALLSLQLPAGRYPPLNLTPQEQKQRTLDALVAWTLEEAEQTANIRPVGRSPLGGSDYTGAAWSAYEPGCHGVSTHRADIPPELIPPWPSLLAI